MRFTLVCTCCAILAGSCGRVGYDGTGSAGDGGATDGAVPDAADGGTPVCEFQSEDQVSCSDGVDNDCDELVDLADPDCGNALCMVVTTNSNELDAGESAQPPHLGAGLSLAEAITMAGSQSGADCIVFETPMTLSLTANLPNLTGADGTRIDGGGSVILEPQGAVPIGLTVEANGSSIVGLTVRNFTVDSGILLRAGNCTVGPGNVLESNGIGVIVNGVKNTVTGNRISNSTVEGVQVKSDADDTAILFNLLYGNAKAVFGQSTTRLSIIHNTLVDNGIGLDLKLGSTNVVLENNLFVGTSGVAVDAAGTIFSSLDYCDFIDNGTDCDGCSVGANSLAVDPAFVDKAAKDYSLSRGSPVIDKGRDTGLDTNGAASGLFNGTAPDMGALEAR